jgi:hypothetical protein
MWRKKIPPMTITQRMDVAGMLASVGELLTSKRGVPDSDRLIKLFNRFVSIAELPTPLLEMPTAYEKRLNQSLFLSDDEIMPRWSGSTRLAVSTATTRDAM